MAIPGKPTIHELKCWPNYFQAIADERKLFDIRNNTTRGFQAGDTLHLREWDPDKKLPGYGTGDYTNREMWCDVLYVLAGHGLKDNYVCMSIIVRTAPS
jgi:hypothetical protein